MDEKSWSMILSLAAVILLAAVGLGPRAAAGGEQGDGASAGASGAVPCSQRYRPAWAWRDCRPRPGMAVRDALGCWSLDLDDRLWGSRNLSIAAGTEPDPVLLRAQFPRGSVNPGNREAPTGGAGFYGALLGAAGTEAACLRYAVRFESDFAFARGGKLPGLYGGSGASGCEPAAGDDEGFSVRFMWRPAGAGEVYAYLPDNTTRCGRSLGRGAWHFAPGRWTELELEVVLNRPAAADGVLRAWADGQLMVEETGVTFRTVEALTVRGIFFSTFFGGSDPSWASPRDQHADFADFALFAP